MAVDRSPQKLPTTPAGSRSKGGSSGTGSRTLKDLGKTYSVGGALGVIKEGDGLESKSGDKCGVCMKEVEEGLSVMCVRFGCMLSVRD